MVSDVSNFFEGLKVIHSVGHCREETRRLGNETQIRQPSARREGETHSYL